jgi:hypothetical protein
MPPKTPPPLPSAVLVSPRWEYKVFTLGLKAVEDAEQVLNELGEQCWEMIDMLRDDAGKVIFAFKRRKRPA